ncbi:MAG: hypothetical protein WC364_11555 [Eubacteriales bacterium]
MSRLRGCCSKAGKDSKIANKIGTVLEGINRKFCEEKGLKYQATPGFEP